MIACQLTPGIVPSRAYCDYPTAVVGQIPVLFGMAPGVVEHHACQADGAERCLTRLAWRRRGGPWGRRRHLLAHSRPRTPCVSSTSSTSRDRRRPVSTDDLESIVARIALRAARTVRAPSHLIADRCRHELAVCFIKSTASRA